MRQSRLLADGRERLLMDTDLQAELDLAVADIEAKYAPLLKEAGFIRRFELRRRMRREIEREIEHHAPRAALYVRA